MNTRNMNSIGTITEQEKSRQKATLNLIASENYPSPAVLDLVGSVWSNKYAEGYPKKRYYAGNHFSDEMESLVQQKALEVFNLTGGYGVNVQVLSGSPANSMVYLSVLQPGDTIMSLSLASGGHLSHLHETSNWLKFFKHISYKVQETSPGCYEVDQTDFQNKLEEFKPKLTIIGFSAYPRAYSFQNLIRQAHQAGSLVLADIAHINGLVAAGLHDSPFHNDDSGADFVSMTTHKTLRGPRGAMLFAKENWIEMINKTVFPGTSGGPHLNTIAAVGQSLLEITGESFYPDNRSFKEYSQAILKTCKALENGLRDGGLEIISPTQNHLCLVKLQAEMDSLVIQKKLESVGIITNRNQIPNDTKTAWRPSGLRLGTAALASRGLTIKQAWELGKLIADIIFGRINEETTTKLVTELVSQLDWWYD